MTDHQHGIALRLEWERFENVSPYNAIADKNSLGYGFFLKIILKQTKNGIVILCTTERSTRAGAAGEDSQQIALSDFLLVP